MFSLDNLAEAVLSSQFDKTKKILENGRFDLNNNNIEYSVEQMHTAPVRRISLPSIIHLAVHKNNPRILSLLVNGYKADIRQLEENSGTKFLSVLVNRDFNLDVSVASALNNIDILYKSGASLSEAAVSQLIVFYHAFPGNRDRLRKIIKKLYILKTTHQFLDHVKNNRVREAKYLRDTNINRLHPGLNELGISGYIDPNYNGGVHGMAILLAAEHPNTAMLDFLSEQGTNYRGETLTWQIETNLSLRNAEGVTILHILAKTGHINALKDVCEKLTRGQIQQLLIAKTNGPGDQQYTPFALAEQYEQEEVAAFLKNLINEDFEFVFTKVKTENPVALKVLEEAGCSFANRHPINGGNILHYAIIGKQGANLRWLWRKLSSEQKEAFLLQQVKMNEPGDIMLTPLQLAQRLGEQNLVNVLSDFAIELAQISDVITLKKLEKAGYNLKRVNFYGYNVLHYAVLGKNKNNVAFLLNGMELPQIMTLLDQKTADGLNKTPLEMAQDFNLRDIVAYLNQYKQLQIDFNQPYMRQAFGPIENLPRTLAFFQQGQPSQIVHHQAPIQPNPMLFSGLNSVASGANTNDTENVVGGRKNVLGKRTLEEFSQPH